MAVDDVLAAVADWKLRIPAISLYSDYYRGRHRIGEYATEAFRRDFQWILENARENLCKAVVRGFSSKMVIQGWDGAKTDVARAGEMIDALGMTRVFNLTHREAHRTGDAYVMVWPDANNIVRPWTHLSSTAGVFNEPGDPETLRVYYRVWINSDGYGRVNLYYADRLERWASVKKVRERTASPNDPATWPERADGYGLYDGDGDGEVISHDFGRVPATWFPHDADELGAHGRSVLEDVIPIQDALNKSVADLIVGGENFAQPLRALMNYRAQVTIDPATGEKTTESIDANPTVNKLLAVPGDGPLVQLDPPDATKLLAVHEAYALKASRVTGLPAFYVSQVSGEPPTGVALRVLSTRLTSLASETHTDFGPKWADHMDLMGVPDVRPIWQDPAPVDETERLEQAEIRKGIGYGLAEILKRLGEDPDDIARIMAEPRPGVNGGALAARAFEAGVDPAELLG